MKRRKAVCFRDKYNFIAPFYDPMASLFLGGRFQKSKRVFLDVIQPGDTVWVIGGGTGDTLPELMERCGKNGLVIFMEASSKMLEMAKRRIPSDAQCRIKFIYSNDFKLPSKLKIDVVITQFLMDVLTDRAINSLVEEVSQNVSQATSWLFLDFYPMKSKRWMIRLMISSFKILTKHPRKELPDYDRFFRAWCWHEIKTACFEKGFYQAKIYKLAPKAIKPDTISLK